MSAGQKENAKKKEAVSHEKEIVKIPHSQKFSAGQESNHS